ncbi:nucleotidyltransferase family protein [Psychroserpens algicola]|uniref:Nucleotidyltransferase family protein n=1 Tax=Psychroserpens algicola TaxID=1719034 RepID=A0ABT0H837_9FLAO|nr:nucleotidyltransferase family protein [Psychroserpens algicola]MCK8480530.1 nucleotidyltransferase family protein [Psychroserpens algicola]
MSSTKTTYKDTLSLIAEILSFSNSTTQLRHKLESEPINWDKFVELSSSQLVLTTCYCRLKEKQLLDLIPNDLVLYLEELTSINRNRNLTLIDEIKAITQAFDVHNINYVLLKGAAILIGHQLKDLGERMVGDVDILVSSEHISEAYQLIKDLGYNQSKGFNYDVTNFRHLPRQFTDDKMAVIELHSSILDLKFKHLIDEDLIFNTKIKHQDGIIPSAYAMNIINVMGLQINSKGYQYKHWFLRNLYDSLVLKLDQQTDLLNDYKNNTYFIDYLSKYHAVFKCLPLTVSNRKLSRHIRYYDFKFRQFWLHQIIYKTSYIFYSIYDRITLFLNNSSYRSHVLKRYISTSKV